MLYLQRLANPLLPYNVSVPLTDPEYNPYRTIDMMSIDMTAFNGLCDNQNAADRINGRQHRSDFETRQRGDGNDSSVSQGLTNMNLWTQDPSQRPIGTQPTLRKRPSSTMA